MNVLIAGNNEINEALAQNLTLRGISTHIIPCIENLVSLKGKPGFFSAVTTGGEVTGAGVIITQPPAFEDTIIKSGKALGLHEPGLMANLEAAEHTGKIIFLLDYLAETPEYLTAKALTVALRLAGQGRQVVVLSRFIKTSTYGMEQVYSDARQAGVSFIKYEHVNCDFEAGEFKITAFDGVFESEFITPVLVAAGREQTTTREQIIQKFRLAKSNDGYINGNKFFLGPVLTSRRGVFYISPDLCHHAENLDYAVSLVLPELRSLEAGPTSYAEIDAKKCAFCYTCYRVCPHAALEPDLGADVENNAMTCESAACTACGACAAICPGQAITIRNASTDVPVSKGTCKVFNCQNAVDFAPLPLAGKLDIEEIPCGGSTGQDKIAAALADYDKVLLAVCMDDACRHMVGGKRGCQQAVKLMESVVKMGLEGKNGKKIACVKTSAAMQETLKAQIQEFLQG